MIYRTNQSNIFYISISYEFLRDTQNTKTDTYYGINNVIDAEVQFILNAKIKIDTCMNYRRPPLAILIEPIKKSFLDAKDRDVELRYLTEINSSNKSYCKELIGIVNELRHLDGIKANSMISETEYLAPLILYEE
jgi:two-component system sensor histidine kinase VicK